MSKERLEETERMKLHAIEHGDKAMLRIIEQAERVPVLEFYKQDWMLVTKQNKRYREFIKTISDPWEVARKIVKGTNKKGASAEEIVAWIEREAERILEGEE